MTAALTAGTQVGAAAKPAVSTAHGAQATMSSSTPNTSAAVEDTYRLPLALGYLVPLTFEVVAGVWLDGTAYPTAGFAAQLAAPFIVHAAHGNSSGGGLALLGSVSSIVGGGVLGGLILIQADYDVCRDCDDNIGEVASQFVVGGFYGAAAGYLLWGAFDTAYHARVTRPVPSLDGAAPERARISPSVAPVVARAETGQLIVSGFTLGVLGTL